MSWLAPEIEVAIDNQTDSESVGSLVVTAARGQPVATMELELSNVRFEWEELRTSLESGEANIIVRWGYRGGDLFPLFDGTVKRWEMREKLRLVALCRCRALVDTLVTRTYFQETATTIVKHLVENCGFAEEKDITQVDTVLDKLPLDQDSIVSALEWLDRRLKLGYAFWADPSGVFHWAPPNEAQEADQLFTHGEDIIDWQVLPGDRRLLTVAGTSIWHSQVVGVQNRGDQDFERYFIEQVRHTAGGGNSVGLRTYMWLRRLA